MASIDAPSFTESDATRITAAALQLIAPSGISVGAAATGVCKTPVSGIAQNKHDFFFYGACKYELGTLPASTSALGVKVANEVQVPTVTPSRQTPNVELKLGKDTGSQHGLSAMGLVGAPSERGANTSVKVPLQIADMRNSESTLGVPGCWLIKRLQGLSIYRREGSDVKNDP